MSLIAQPKSEVSNLMDELNRLKETSDFSELDLKRLKKKAESIKNNVDLAKGFGLLGIIACLENDIAAMRSYSERAIQQSGGDPFQIVNYAGSLQYFGLFGEAYEQASKAYEKDRSFLHSLNYLIITTCILNKKDEFEQYADAWLKLTRKDHALKTNPLFYPIKSKDCYAFLRKHSDPNALPPGHLTPKDMLEACGPEIARIFGTPISAVLEIMPDSSWEPNLVVFVQWFGDMEEGMKRHDLFEDWYIENEYDLKTDLVVITIEFVGE